MAKRNREPKKKRARKKPIVIHKHHVIPSSRGGDKLGEDDIVRIDGNLHMKYHSLFGNLNPSEILAWLESYFWGGKRKQLEEKMKGD